MLGSPSPRWHQLAEDGGDDAQDDADSHYESDGNGDGDGDEEEEAKDDDEPGAPTEHRIDIDGEDRDDTDSFWDDESSLEQRPRRWVPPPPAMDDDHSIIDVLSSELRGQAIPSYMDQFEVVIPDAEVVIGAVPVEVVERREREIEDAKVRQRELEVELYRQRETRLAQREVEARRRLEREAARRQQELAKQKLQFAETMQLRTRRLGYVFQQAEHHLRGVLRGQQARVQQVFGQLEHSRRPAERKRYRVEWDQIPVTLKIRAKMLRALKDKLPSGHYVLLVTLYDRLGGHALHWTAWDPEENDGGAQNTEKRSGRKRPRHSAVLGAMTATSASSAAAGRVDRPCVTRPFAHRGRFFHTDVGINQSMYVVCPPQSLLRPGNVLVFELFMLDSGRQRPTRQAALHSPRDSTVARETQLHDQIVAWGAMPLMTPEFEYVDGKYKIPFLRGEMDATMDKYRDIEDMYTEDLSAWLCNFYFQVSPLRADIERLILDSERRGRHVVRAADHSHYDVEIDERNALFRAASSSSSSLVAKRGLLSSETLRVRKKMFALERDDQEDPTAPAQPRAESVSTSATMLIDDNSHQRHTGKSTARRGLWGMFWGGSEKTSTARITKRGKLNKVYTGDVVVPQRDEVEDAASSPGEATPDGPRETREPLNSPRSKLEEPIEPPHHASVASVGEELADTDELELEAPGRLDVENYKFSVNPVCARETAQQRRFHTTRKLHYLRHELFVDMGVTKMHTMEFWSLLVLLLFALWLRVYLHYIMQWVFLKAQRVPVFYFQPRWTTCVVKYTWKTVTTHTEIGVLLAGVLGNWLFFAFLTLTAAISQSTVGELPHFGSKFIVCVGVATVLDPLLVFAVDLWQHNHNCSARADCLLSLTAASCQCVEGDAFKLYTRFLAQEGSGLVGIFLTLILYAALTCLSLVAFYMYLLHVHMNGRMLDVYRRIHAQETDLFVPHDCEISLQELRGICDQASRWRGPKGTQRKIFVHDYVLRDPLDPAFEERSTHIAVYNIELDGQRELFRHFLKSHDGAIVELFGEVGPGHDGSWAQGTAGTSVSSLALIYNILQEHPQSPATMAAEYSELLRQIN